MKKLISILVLILACQASLPCAAQNADSGDDKTLAPGMLYMLDARESTGTGALRYRWSQVSGDAVEIIGWDRPCAFVVSPDDAGAYVFRVTVTDDSSSDTDDVTLTVVSYTANIVFVDDTIESSSCENYDPVTRSCGSGSYTAYKSPQGAADVVNPGDSVYIRGGQYDGTVSSFYAPTLDIQRSGTAGAPITFTNYQDEEVILNSADESYPTGRQWTLKIGTQSDADGDPPGSATNYIIIDGLTVIGGQKGIGVCGGLLDYTSRYVTVRNCVARDNYGSGIDSTGSIEFVLVEYCEVTDSQFSGIHLDYFGDKTSVGGTTPKDRIAAKYCIVQNNLCHGNRYESKAGDIDGIEFGFSYQCAVRKNVVYDNDDDGIDVYGGVDCLIEDNIVFGQNGDGDGGGIKMGTGGGGRITARGNVIFGNKATGFDGDTPNSYDNPNFGNTFCHNAVYYNGSWGFFLSGDIQRSDPTSKYVLRNNAALDNDQSDFNQARDDIFGPTEPTKHDSDYNRWKTSDLSYMQSEVSSDAHSTAADPAWVNPGTSIDLTLTGMTITEKLAHIRNQARQRFSLSAGSAMIDAGVLIPGYHFATAGSHSGESGRAWYGAAPDLGAFEYISESATSTKFMRVTK